VKCGGCIGGTDWSGHPAPMKSSTSARSQSPIHVAPCRKRSHCVSMVYSERRQIHATRARQTRPPWQTTKTFTWTPTWTPVSRRFCTMEMCTPSITRWQTRRRLPPARRRPDTIETNRHVYKEQQINRLHHGPNPMAVDAALPFVDVAPNFSAARRTMALNSGAYDVSAPLAPVAGTAPTESATEIRSIPSGCLER
jgi:hypothetical protein